MAEEGWRCEEEEKEYLEEDFLAGYHGEKKIGCYQEEDNLEVISGGGGGGGGIDWGVIAKMRRIKSLYNADGGSGWDLVGLELVLAGVIIQVGGEVGDIIQRRGEVVIATRRMRRGMRMMERGVCGRGRRWR